MAASQCLSHFGFYSEAPQRGTCLAVSLVFNLTSVPTGDRAPKGEEALQRERRLRCRGDCCSVVHTVLVKLTSGQARLVWYGRGWMADRAVGVPFAASHRHSSGRDSILHNGPLLSAILACLVAQVLKLITHRVTDGSWSWKRIASSGGMPSSHTALVAGLSTAVGLQEGLASPLFAICLVFWLVVMYDASGVRLAAGRHATVLNMIISEMPPDHPVQDSERLRDSLGHTPRQVALHGLL